MTLIKKNHQEEETAAEMTLVRAGTLKVLERDAVVMEAG